MTPDIRDVHAPIAGHPLGDALVEAYMAALAAVDPTVLVRKAVRQGLLDDWLFPGGATDRAKPERIQVLALGKAAGRMAWGLVEGGVPFEGIGVAPVGTQVPGVDTVRWLHGEHPVPGQRSREAAAAVLEWARARRPGEPVLALLSGGASSCLEAPAEGVPWESLVSAWEESYRAGLPIEELNRQRAARSAVKGGRLGSALLGRTPNVRVWVLADTDPATAAQAVGSGPLWQPGAPTAIPHAVLAGNDALVVAAGLRLGLLGFQVYRHAPRIEGPVDAEVRQFVAAFALLPKRGPVALVGGGEPLQRVPPGAPPGGRCQHAALVAALELKEHGLEGAFLAAASDGVDGTTDASAAWATAQDGDDAAKAALEAFGSHSLLRRRGRLLHMGATGTNVNDLWVMVRR